MDDLTGKVAFVTGASRGIGRAIALALADAGADVVVGCRQDVADAQAVAAAVEAKGRRALVVAADLSDAGRAQDAAARAAALGPVDILVNNAGINPSRPLEQLTAEDWDRTLAVNLSSVFHLTQALLPGMRARRWGRIIILSSVAAQVGGVIGPAYAASKAGLLGLVHSYAHLLAKEGITANAIAPALIDTHMIKDNPAMTPDRIPIGRFGQPDEVAAIAVMLARNAYVTGQTINANGGWYMS